MVSQKPDMSSELALTALRIFAERGVEGTTIQEIADAAGCGKSNVLYHFGSKAGLVSAMLQPGLDAFDAYVAGLESEGAAAVSSPDSMHAFVDLVVGHREAVQLAINRTAELPEGPLRERIDDLTARLDAMLERSPAGPAGRLTLSVLMGGIVFVVAGPLCPPSDDLPEVRRLLLLVLAQLLEAPTATLSTSDLTPLTPR